MRALRIPATRAVLAAALMVGCAMGLSNPAQADQGKSWGRQDYRHGAHRDHGRHHFDAHPRYGRFDGPRGPRYRALPPPVRFRSYGGPAFHGSIVIRSAPRRLVLAAPLLPPPRIILPPVHYGVTELGRVR